MSAGPPTEPPQPGEIEAEPVPHASRAVLAATTALEAELVAERPVAIGALLAATGLLRIGSVGAGLAIGFELTDRGADARIIGVVLSINLLSELVLAPVLARYADRLGRTRFLIGGPLVGALGLLLVAVVLAAGHGHGVHTERVALARLFEGIAAAAFIPTALGTIAAATSHSVQARARASGAFEAATLAGYAFGGLLAGFVHHALHATAISVFALFYLGAAGVCARWVPRVPPLPVSPLGVIIRAITGRGPIRTFLPAWLATFAIIGAFLVNLPPVLKSPGETFAGQLLVHRIDERTVSVILTVALVLLVLGIALWTPRLPIDGAARTMRHAAPGAMVFCLGLIALNHAGQAQAAFFLPVIVIGVLILAGFGPAAVTYLAECSETFAADRSALMAFYTLTLAAGGLFGGIAGGFATRWLHLDGLALLGLLLSAFAFLALGRVVRYEKALVHQVPELAAGLEDV